jgi:hypothetical protein
VQASKSTARAEEAQFRFDEQSAPTEEPLVIGAVYFVASPDNSVMRVGYDGDPINLPRAKHHGQYGYYLVAVMPGTKDLENAFHSRFASVFVQLGRSESHYQIAPVLDHVELLVRAGFATNDPTDLQYMAAVPIDLALNPPKPTDRKGQYLSFLPPDPPVVRMERAARHYCHSSNMDEWFTPEPIIAAARKTLGAIDLDPASNWKANHVVRARHIYTIQASGLDPQKPWTGRVWMNPPFKDIGPVFAQRLVREYTAGSVKAACALFTTGHTSAEWFHPIAEYSSGLAITRGRFKFKAGHSAQEGRDPAPPCGHVVLYFGSRVDLFASAFGEICVVYSTLSKPSSEKTVEVA